MIFDNFCEFWKPQFWLPSNLSWSDFEPTDKLKCSHSSHLKTYPFLFAIAILIIRILFEKLCFGPLGLSIGIKNVRPRNAVYNKKLEKEYENNNKRWSHQKIKKLIKQTDWTERQIQRWLRLRKAQDKPPPIKAFTESCWRGLYYTFSFIYGLVVLWDKPWLWDIQQCWRNFPYHEITNDIWWYYMISLGFYWSLMVSQFFDVKRKDFYEVMLHHFITISLLSTSWILNAYRFGSLILLIHDAADTVLDTGKAIKIGKYQKTLMVMMVIFVIVWIITRLILFPFWILRSCILDIPTELMCPLYYLINGLMIVLFMLHIFWTKLIVQAIYRTIILGDQFEDARSCSSGLETDDDRK